MKGWQIAVIAGIVLAAAAFTAVAIAAAGGAADNGDRAGMMESTSAIGQPGDGKPGNNAQDGTGPGGYGWGQRNGQGGMGQGQSQGGMSQGGGARGLYSQLTDEQRERVDDLREQHHEDMQDWWEEYGDDPDSDAARDALQELRMQQRQELEDLFDDLGIEGVGRGLGHGYDGQGAEDCPGTDSTPGWEGETQTQSY
jgi:hypothetical protein